MEFFLRIIRSYLLNKTTNLNLKNFSKKIVRKLVSIKLNSSQNVNEKIFSKINPIDNNDLNAGETLVAFIDILFIIIFLLVISLLSLNLGIISFLLALIFTLLIFSKIKIKNYLNKKLLFLSEKTYVKKSIKPGKHMQKHINTC